MSESDNWKLETFFPGVLDGFSRQVKIVVLLWFFNLKKYFFVEEKKVPSCERKKEIKRRRHRKEKLAQFQNRLRKGTLSKDDVADKLRKLTIGAEDVIENWGLNG